MSSSSVNSRGRRVGLSMEWPNCYCRDRNCRERNCRELKAALKVSGTDENPGRRFFACARYPDPERCNFFEWIDKPICQRGKVVILEQKEKIVNLQNEMEYWKQKAKLLEEKLTEFEKKAEDIGKRSQVYERRNNCVKLLLALVVLVVACMVYGKFKYGLKMRDLHSALPR